MVSQDPILFLCPSWQEEMEQGRWAASQWVWEGASRLGAGETTRPLVESQAIFQVLVQPAAWKPQAFGLRKHLTYGLRKRTEVMS